MEGEDGKNSSARVSFCVPKLVIQALLDSKATAYEICAYLVLARFTEASGMYSTASLAAINRYTGANKTRNGPIAKALARLKTIHAKRTEIVSNGRAGKSHAFNSVDVDLGPILIDRESWLKLGSAVPDGPTPRGMVNFILPGFDEPISDRVWLGGNLIDGFGEFKMPLKKVKDGGDATARLLLGMYMATDMQTWGGVNPNAGPRVRYEPAVPGDKLTGGARLIRARRVSEVSNIDPRIAGGNNQDYWDAHSLLVSLGLFYEVVVVVNRNGIKKNFADGREYLAIPDDAEPLYELDARSLHGYKPQGEEGLGGLTAKTAGAIGRPVTGPDGSFDGTYAAIVREGQGAMIVGIYRPRFRPANLRNAGVAEAWARIHEGSREALSFIQHVRAAYKLDPS